MKIVLTGGHVAPTLALIPLIAGRHEMIFIGRKHTFETDRGASFEYQTVRELGIPFYAIASARLQRHFSRYTIPSLLKFPLATLQAIRILAHDKPDVVLTFGGYVALPVCLAAVLLRIPVVLHEQTLKGGLTNKLIAPFARKICVSFAETLSFFPAGKTVLTGNPVRRELLRPPKTSPFTLPALPLIYITGGSGGSHTINLLIEEILPKLLSSYAVIHQTGDARQFNDFDRLQKKRETFSKEIKARYIMQKFLNVSELAWVYRHAKLLLGRCGANTVYEILSFGVPSLLIPLPWAAEGEQEENGRLVEKAGLGIVLAQETLTPARLLSTITRMIEEHEKFLQAKGSTRRLVIPDAAKRILSVLEGFKAHES